jgi:adenine specific DNA methylase Mod
MPDQQSRVELFDVAELPGRPMLHWHGKRPLREIPYYPAQLRERYGEGNPPDGWVNRLYWGNNLQVMAHLIREFRGGIKLIYIDPPFDSGADYRKRIRLRGHKQVLSDLGIIEERQYTDIWSNDLYLQYMYERLVLIRELLAEDGSLCLHCDRRAVHRLRLILDEVFGANNFVNEIIWKHTVLGGAHGRALPKAHETILWYGKTSSYQFNDEDKAARVPFGDYIQKTLRQDKEGRWYYTRGNTRE